MKYSCVLLAVSDIAASRKFYEDLFGLELESDYGINIAFVGGIALQQQFGWLVGLPEETVQKNTHNMELVFEEADFDGFLAKLRQYPGVRLLGDVVEHGWGQRVVRFYDLDGHLIEVGEEMKTVVRRFLDAGLTREETAKRMDVTVAEVERLFNQ